MLVFCLVAALTVVPATARDQTLRQMAASAVYVQNWTLAADSTDYLAL